MSHEESTNDSEEFFKQFASVINLIGDSESVIKLFDKISSGYVLNAEKCYEATNRRLVRLLFDQKGSEKNLTKDCAILDVACGTGVIGRLLRESGFSGNLEGVDGSQGMLNEAAKLESVYNKLYTEILTPGVTSSIQKEKYEVVIASHAFFPQYLDANHLEMMFSFLKRGGMFVFNLKYDVMDDPTEVTMSFVADFDKKLKHMEQNGICRCLDVIKVDAPRLNFINPIKGNNLDQQFVNERQQCFQKL